MMDSIARLKKKQLIDLFATCQVFKLTGGDPSVQMFLRVRWQSKMRPVLLVNITDGLEWAIVDYKVAIAVESSCHLLLLIG